MILAVKKTKKKPAAKKKPAKKKTVAVPKRTKKTKKAAVIKSKTRKKPAAASRKKLQKKIIIAANDTPDDLENLSPEEIDRELKDYERAPKPPLAKISGKDLKSQHLAERVGQLMFEKKAEDVVVANLEGLTSVTDYFVICTASSDLHARAIADHVADELGNAGVHPHHREGYTSLRWILIDYVDVIVHVFQKEAREFYDLERLWGDAQFKSMKDNA
jgi:ribosome-associated protein